jgi:hypothetical protein
VRIRGFRCVATLVDGPEIALRRRAIARPSRRN